MTAPVRAATNRRMALPHHRQATSPRGAQGRATLPAREREALLRRLRTAAGKPDRTVALPLRRTHRLLGGQGKVAEAGLPVREGRDPPSNLNSNRRSNSNSNSNRRSNSNSSSNRRSNSNSNSNRRSNSNSNSRSTLAAHNRRSRLRTLLRISLPLPPLVPPSPLLILPLGRRRQQQQQQQQQQRPWSLPLPSSPPLRSFRRSCGPIPPRQPGKSSSVRGFSPCSAPPPRPSLPPRAARSPPRRATRGSATWPRGRGPPGTSTLRRGTQCPRRRAKAVEVKEEDPEERDPEEARSRPRALARRPRR
jgi:hypothetical protein